MILKIIAIVFVALLLLFVYSACVVSSRCSRIEENYLHEEENNISILQEFEQIKKDLGSTRYRAIAKYLNKVCSKEQFHKYENELKKITMLPMEEWLIKEAELKEKYNVVLLNDVLYKEEEYKLFDKWFQEQLSPFHIMKFDGYVSVTLSQEQYWYDWVKEIKTDDNYYGDGHCYEELFKDYLEKYFSNLTDTLEYDSENGMFCVYCKDMRIADKIAYELSKLYKNEDKMISLIKETKKIHDYHFDNDIHI